MDNGEVIPGLNESWTLGGAKAFEWVAGFMAAIIFSELVYGGPHGRAMPMLLAVGAFTTFSLATLRRRFPDEERGMRNHVMTLCGLQPPGLPAPAPLQPYWSGCPVRDLREDCELRQLGIWDVLQEIAEEEKAPNTDE